MIRVELSSSEVTIEPGNTAQLSVAVTNQDEQADHVFLEIEGLDVEWYALPVPAVTIAPGETAHARVLFKVGRSTDVQAGTYPFLVRCRSMESGTAAVEQASLAIKRFSALQGDLDPKRATSTILNRENVFDFRVTNLGNHAETLDLYASDPEDACAYEFEKDRVAVKPGATETVPMLVEPRSRPIIGSSRLYQFTVTARSAEDAYVSVSAHGQLERKAVLSTVVALVSLAAVLAACAWFVFRPRPVAIRSFGASVSQTIAGDPVVLSWDIANPGDGCYITPGSIPVRSSVGTVTVNPAEPTTYTLVARGGGVELKRELAIAVSPRPPAPKARIKAFTASPTRVHQGEPVTLTWKVSGATALVLNPVGTLNSKMDQSRQVVLDQTTTFVLSVQGQSGDVVTKSLTVTVVPPNVSVAEITAFKATPAAVHGGEVSTLRWTVLNASTVEIDNQIGGGLEHNGKFDVTPQQTTVYTIRATDSKGNVTTRQVTVTVLPPEVPPGDTIQPGGAAGTMR